MLETILASETSVNFNVTTRRYMPEDSKLHARSRENLKPHILELNPRRVVLVTENSTDL
jgi:hypothetical protein